MHVSSDRQREVLEIITETPWGDTAGALALVDEALAIAMRATREEFVFWEDHAESAGFVDEFSIDDLSALSHQWRDALVARLIRSIALAYGVGTDCTEDRIGQIETDRSAAATPLRALLAATSLPLLAARNTPAIADVEAWEGDFENLRGHEDDLFADRDLCDRVFESKHDAFCAAYALAAVNASKTPLRAPDDRAE